MGQNTNNQEDGLLFKTNFALSWIKVYRDRVVFNEAQKMFGVLNSTTVPIAQISDVSTNALLAQVTILTTGGKQYKITTNKKSQVKQAIFEAQTALNGGKSNSQTSSVDEIVKLSELKEKGIITQDEFDKKKKQLLDI